MGSRKMKTKRKEKTAPHMVWRKMPPNNLSMVHPLRNVENARDKCDVATKERPEGTMADGRSPRLPNPMLEKKGDGEKYREKKGYKGGATQYSESKHLMGRKEGA